MRDGVTKWTKDENKRDFRVTVWAAGENRALDSISGGQTYVALTVVTLRPGIASESSLARVMGDAAISPAHASDKRNER